MTTPATHLVTEVVRLQRIIHRLKQNPPGADGADRSAHVLLVLLRREGPMRLSDVAARVHVDASTVSRQVAQLVSERLLERRPDPHDRRASVLALTDAGDQHAEALVARRSAFFERTVQAWSGEDLETFTTLLHRFVDDTEAAYAAAWADAQQDSQQDTQQPAGPPA